MAKRYTQTHSVSDKALSREQPECGRVFVILPAAGIGQRYAGDRPKQYTVIHDKAVIQHTIERLLSFADITEIIVALHPDDQWFAKLDVATHAKVRCVIGGERRSDSVLAALEFLTESAEPDDWVAVHDAVRPCLSQAAWDRLWDALRTETVGGLLAVPVRDTLKYVDDHGRVLETRDRTDLWQAQTPQVFRFELLYRALRQFANDHGITDEASVVEKLGLNPKVILGDVSNLKLTHPGDEVLLEAVLRGQSL